MEEKGGTREVTVVVKHLNLLHGFLGTLRGVLFFRISGLWTDATSLRKYLPIHACLVRCRENKVRPLSCFLSLVMIFHAVFFFGKSLSKKTPVLFQFVFCEKPNPSAPVVEKSYRSRIWTWLVQMPYLMQGRIMMDPRLRLEG